MQKWFISMNGLRLRWKQNKYMEKQKKISVVMPVYNCEKYIARSIRSVLAQTYGNWELIIVNDGSEDSTEKIVQGFAKSDQRIRIINQRNQGVSVARNRGIDEAAGDLLMFLDADDWFERDAFQEVVCNWDNSIQMLLFDYYDVPEKGRKQYRTLFKEDRIVFGKEGDHSIAELELITAGVCRQQGGIRVLVSVPWGRVFKIDYIKQKAFRFPEGIINCEDVIFNMQAINGMEKAVYLSKPIYDYYINLDSASNAAFEKNGEKLLLNYIRVNHYAKDILLSGKNDLYQKAFYRLVFDEMKAIFYWIADEKAQSKKMLGRKFCFSQVEEVRKQIWGDCGCADKVLLLLCEKKCFSAIEVIVSAWKKMKRVLNIR